MTFLELAERDRLVASNYVDAIVASTLVSPYLEIGRVIKVLVKDFIDAPPSKRSAEDLKLKINEYLRNFVRYTWSPNLWSQEFGSNMITRGALDSVSWIMEQAPAVQREQILSKYFFQPDSLQPITDDMAYGLFDSIENSIDEHIDYYLGTVDITGDLAIKKLKSSVDDDIAMGMFWLANMGSWSMWNGYTNGIFDVISLLPALVSVWMWWAVLDAKTCASCILLHGTLFPVAETLLDHPHGRCIPLPIIISDPFSGVALPPMDIETGEEWFMAQAASVQKGVLGNAGYGAWKNGAVSLSDFSESHDHFLYGSFRRQASLSSILGEHKARVYYGQ